MKIYSKDEILKAEDLKRELVPVPEWGKGAVYVRTMTGEERDAYDQSNVGENENVDLVNFRAKLLARTIVDEKGERIFTDDDINQLGKKSSLALNRLFEVAQRLNGLGAREMEEMIKNSEGGPGEDSG